MFIGWPKQSLPEKVEFFRQTLELGRGHAVSLTQTSETTARILACDAAIATLFVGAATALATFKGSL